VNDAEDAARWRHCIKHGFPVRNQTTTTGRAWIAFRVIGGLDFVHYGDSPAEAIDDARAADMTTAATDAT
jgi:hypothetical protein